MTPWQAKRAIQSTLGNLAGASVAAAFLAAGLHWSAGRPSAEAASTEAVQVLQPVDHPRCGLSWRDLDPGEGMLMCPDRRPHPDITTET